MNITITSEVGKGRSTIAYAIKTFLEEKGFVVNFEDKDHFPSYFQDDKQNERLKHIAEKRETINIEMTQLPRKTNG